MTFEPDIAKIAAKLEEVKDFPSLGTALVIKMTLESKSPVRKSTLVRIERKLSDTEERGLV